MTTDDRPSFRGQHFPGRGARALHWARAGIPLATIIGVFSAAPALGQSPPPAGTDTSAASTAKLEEVTVTGSRIARSDGFETPTPVSVLSAEDLNQTALPNVGDAVNRLPEFAGSVTSSNLSTNVSSGTAGVNNLSLRGLGADRTLVLLDGQRVVSASVAGTNNNGGSVDINILPQALIKRVEVVTGGASAAYGSDALAGVVNFILDKDFTGVKAEVNGGITTYGDDPNYKLDLTAGTPFANGRGHLLFSGTHANDNGIVHNTRAWNQVGYNTMLNPANPLGNPGFPQYITQYNVGLANATPGGLIVGCNAGAQTLATCPFRGTQFGPGGAAAPFAFGSPLQDESMVGGDWQQSRIDEVTGLALPLQRDNLFGRVSFDVTDNVNVYGEAMWAKTHSYNPAIVNYFSLGNINVNSGNPFIPAGIQSAMNAQGITSLTMGSTNQDLGLLQGENTRTTKRYVVGANGSFDFVGTGWKWDSYVERGTTEILSQSPNNLITTNFANALDVVTDPSTGTPVCASGGNCVPYNPFGTGVNGRAVLDYLMTTGWSDTQLEQDVFAASINGSPVSDWAGEVSVAFGAEHRRESVTGSASAQDEANNLFAGNYHPTNGSYRVSEGFVETDVPLAKDLPFAKALDFNGGARFTDYTTSGGVTTWKLGLTWAPLDDLHFRVTRSRDIRAPNLGELYANESGTGPVNDPTINPVTGQPRGLTNIVTCTCGNPVLKPEVANTTGVGIVLTPTFLPGFGASIDYYKINIAQAVSYLGTTTIMNNCIAGETEYCQYIQRNPDGSLHYIQTLPFNVLNQEASGVDVETSYHFTMPVGDMQLRALASYVTKLQTNDINGDIINGVGVNADAMGNVGLNSTFYAPRYRYTMSAIYHMDRYTAGLTARGISAGKYSNYFAQCTTDCPAATANVPTVNNNHIASVTYLDLSLNYKLFKEENGEVFFVMENFLNRDPPMIAGNYGGGFFDGQANTGFYDRLGRTFRAGIRIKL
jgi:iron complex outermembrane receptor protein